MGNYSDLMAEWSCEGIEIVDAYLDLASQFLLEKPSIDPRTQWVLRYLALSCNQSTNSAFLLIANVQTWDAEILLRSVIEGTIKFVYLCLGEENDYISKSEEYLLHLPNIGEIKQQQRIRSFFQMIENPDSDEYAILREELIEDSELEELRNQYPREKRRLLEQKWAFNEIANMLTKNETAIKGFDALRYLLAYTYGLGSHLAHKDATGLRLIHNRLQKSLEDAELHELAYASRQINDLIMMAIFRSAMVYHLHHADGKPVLDLFQSHQQFFDKMKKQRDNFWNKYKV